MKSEWVKVSEKLPKVNKIYGESDYLLCCAEGVLSTPFVGWYNKKLNQWFVAHHLAPTIAVTVCYYTKLPKPPKQ